MSASIEHDESAARAALRSMDIEEPGEELVKLAMRALEGAEEALDENPDVDSNDRSHEIADSELSGWSAIELVGDTPELLEVDDEGIAGGSEATSSQKIEAATYVVLSRIAAIAIEEHRPNMADVLWENAHPPKGYFLVGKSEDEGFIYIQVELRERGHGLELSVVGDVRNGGGQINMHLHPDDFEIAPGLEREWVERLWEIWDEWHLNGMNAGCVHQRKIAKRLGKTPGKIFATRYDLDHPERVRASYDSMFGKQVTEARVRCAICEHDYGSSWLYEPLPEDVLAFVREAMEKAS